MSIKRDVELLFEIGCFRFVERNWKQFLNPDVANNTEHSFRVAWIALLLGRHEGISDYEKLVKMALLHDLPESRTGDVNYVQRMYTKRHELMAVDDMFTGTVYEKEMANLFREYERRDTIEAQIVKDADNLDKVIELCEQAYQGHKMGNLWRADMEKTLQLYTKSAKAFWSEIYTVSPDSWHVNGRNRFNAGYGKPESTS